MGLIPGLGRSPGEGKGNSLQCSCLENPTDRAAWWAPGHGVTKSRTQQGVHGRRVAMSPAVALTPAAPAVVQALEHSEALLLQWLYRDPPHWTLSRHARLSPSCLSAIPSSLAD